MADIQFSHVVMTCILYLETIHKNIEFHAKKINFNTASTVSGTLNILAFSHFLCNTKNTFQFVKSSEETEEVTTHDRDRPGKKLIAG